MPLDRLAESCDVERIPSSNFVQTAATKERRGRGGEDIWESIGSGILIAWHSMPSLNIQEERQISLSLSRPAEHRVGG